MCSPSKVEALRTSPYSECLEGASKPAIVRFYGCLRVKTKRTVEKIGADGVSDRGQGRKRSSGQSLEHSATAIVHPSSVVASERSGRVKVDKNSQLIPWPRSLRFAYFTKKNRRSSGTLHPPDQPQCCLPSPDPLCGLRAPWPRP